MIPGFTSKLFSVIPFVVKLQPWIGIGLKRETDCNQKYGVTVNAGLGMSLGLDDITIGLMQLFSDKDELGDPGSTSAWSFVGSLFSIQIPGIMFSFTIVSKTKLFGPWCLGVGAEWPAQPKISDALAPQGPDFGMWPECTFCLLWSVSSS